MTTNTHASPSPDHPELFSMTDAAAQQILELLSQEKEQGCFLRVAISGGGCSGFQYHFTIDDQQLADDCPFVNNGAQVVVDEVSLNLLKGSYLDFVKDLSSASFVIKNPNAASSCGCGNSFTTK
jgi:iron-sulfur cluster insertion protein